MLRRAARRLVARFRARGVILLYHRALETPSDPQLLSVAPAHLGEHLEYLRRTCRVVSLKALLAAGANGELRRRTVAVTFDDGYADNLHTAKPLLERFEVPATVFVASGSVGSGREFWWDELERLLLLPGSLPATLELTIGGTPRHWELDGTAEYDRAAFERYRSWHVLQDGESSARQHLYRTLCDLLRPLPASARSETLEQLVAWAGAGPSARQSHRPLTAVELSQLGADGLIEIGAHTATHPVLAGLPLADQRDEIDASKQQLEAILGRPVSTFAYPFGGRSDYTADTVEIVGRAGFVAACSNFHGLVGPDADPLQLPRLLVRDWDGDTFAGWLDQLFSD